MRAIVRIVRNTKGILTLTRHLALGVATFFSSARVCGWRGFVQILVRLDPRRND